MKDTGKKQFRGSQKGLILTVILLVLVVGAAAYYLARQQQNKPSSGTVTPVPKASEGTGTLPTDASGSPTPIPTKTTPQTSKNGQVTITAPTQGSTVTSGTKVTGTVTTSTNRLSYRLKGVQSGQLALGTIDVPGAANGPVPFSFELGFTNQVAEGGDQGVLEIFTTGADGAEQSIANVTVNIQG